MAWRRIIAFALFVVVGAVFVNGQQAGNTQVGTTAYIVQLQVTGPVVSHQKPQCAPGMLGCGGSGQLGQGGGSLNAVNVPGSASSPTSLLCTVRNPTMQNTIHIAKQGANNSANATMNSRVWYELSENVATLYPQLFTVTANQLNGSDWLYNFTVIPPITNLHSGIYACAVNVTISANGSSIQLSRVETELIVPYGPSYVNLMADGNLMMNQSVLNVTLGSQHTLSCASCGIPAAMIVMTHGTQDLGSKIMTRDEESMMYSPAPNPTYPFQAPYCRKARAEIKNWIADANNIGVPVVCNSTVNFQSLPPMSTATQFTPTIQDGPPQFTCQDMMFVPPLAEKFYEFRCEVFSKPSLLNASFLGISPNVSEVQILPPNAWHPRSRDNPNIPDVVFAGYLTAVNPMNISQAKFTIRITSIDRQHLHGRTFLLIAVNAKGRTGHQVKLNASDNVNSAVSLMPLSSRSAMFLILLYVFYIRCSN